MHYPRCWTPWAIWWTAWVAPTPTVVAIIIVVAAVELVVVATRIIVVWVVVARTTTIVVPAIVTVTTVVVAIIAVRTVATVVVAIVTVAYTALNPTVIATLWRCDGAITRTLLHCANTLLTIVLSGTSIVAWWCGIVAALRGRGGSFCRTWCSTLRLHSSTSYRTTGGTFVTL